jgi:hypothetical protein
MEAAPEESRAVSVVRGLTGSRITVLAIALPVLVVAVQWGGWTALWLAVGVGVLYVALNPVGSFLLLLSGFVSKTDGEAAEELQTVVSLGISFVPWAGFSVSGLNVSEKTCNLLSKQIASLVPLKLTVSCIHLEIKTAFLDLEMGNYRLVV